MRKLVETIDAVNRAMGKMVAWCALLMMAAQIVSVLLRYVFSYGLITFQEAVVYGHALLFLMGAAYVLQLNQHVRVDIFYNIMSLRTRRLVDIVALVFFVLPVVCVIGWVSFPYILRSWAALEGSRQAGGIPAIFLLKTAIGIFAASVALQAIAIAIRLIGGMEDRFWSTANNSDPER